jgi:hypothetical protein
MGESASVTKGFELAKADFVMVLSADDPLFTDQIFKNVFELFEQDENLVAVYPDWNLIDSDGQVLKKIFVPDYSDELLIKAGFDSSECDGSWTAYRPIGCDRCNQTGYKGRVGIYQVMPITSAMEKIILTQGTAMEIEAQAHRDGIKTLRQAGLVKVKQGMTSLEEVLSCTNQ